MINIILSENSYDINNKKAKEYQLFKQALLSKGFGKIVMGHNGFSKQTLVFDEN